VLASAVISRWPLVGIESFEIPKLSGTVADFIDHLLGLQKQRRPVQVSRVATFLESEISKGRIDIETPQTGFEYPEIFYKFNSVKYPLYRTSSMVSEVAPIVLFLKYLIKQGDLLIIEEPEAHLHPDNQRILARAIVKLIRLGVHVLITTHSDYFVQQISNFILLSRVSEAERVNLKYSKDDYLRADEVGAYLFKLKRGGSVVEPLEVTAEDGIPDDQFLKITEAMLNETARLQRPRVHA
jgi:predicted ATPase